MAKKMKRKFWILTVLLVISCLSLPAAASAKTAKWKNACKTYRSYLVKKQSRYTLNDFYAGSGKNKESASTVSYFLLKDMDSNGIPELITGHVNSYQSCKVTVYTIRSGKMKKLKSFTLNGYTGGGGIAVYSCKKGHIHTYESWGTGNHQLAFRLKSGKIRKYGEYQWNHMTMKTTYKLNGKTVSAAKYNNAFKSCSKNTVNWVVNNSKNRNKLK